MGLYYLEDNDLKCILKATEDKPQLKRITDKLRKEMEERNKGVKNGK